MKVLSGGNMEKIRLSSAYLDVEKTKKYVERIKNNSYCKDFIDKNCINDYIIENSLLTFQHVINDQKLCKNCKGLQFCTKKIKGIVKNLEYEDGHINQMLAPCKYQKNKQKLIKNYYIRDFDDKFLSYRLAKEDIDAYRERIAMHMNSVVSGREIKGMYIFGNSGTGKSYLTICLANRLVENGKTVAYVNARNSVALLRGYVINAKEEFDNFIFKMKNAEVLIIDDLGNEKITDWSRDSVFYDVLDYRLRNKKTKIIITSNYDLKELKELYKVDNEVRAKRFINLIGTVCEEFKLVGLNRFL